MPLRNPWAVAWAPAVAGHIVRQSSPRTLESSMSEPVSTDFKSASEARAFSAFARLRPSRDTAPLGLRGMSKVPEITIYFWIIKILTTGMGESTSDFLVRRLPPPVAVVLAGMVLVLALVLQFRTPRYSVWVYWFAVVMVSVFGTMDADVLHRGLGIPYAVSSTFFAIVLTLVFAAWYRSERTLSIHSIVTRRRETFYWVAVMTTFALGTAAGDLTARTFGLGYLGSGFMFAALFAVPAVLHWGFRLNAVVAFWFAYIVTRPLGASFADWMGFPRTQGGLGLGLGTVSLALSALIIVFVAYLAVTQRDASRADVTA
jgi:uncharacterized membrane-anchored protein